MKKLFILGAVALMGLSFSACSDDNNDNGGTDLTERQRELQIISEIDAEDNVDYTSTNATNWGNYMGVVGQLLVTDATTLYNDWTKSYGSASTGYGEQFKNHQIANIETGLAAVEQIIDGMADISNEVGESKIGDPLTKYTTNWMNKENMREGIYAVESWYSWHSRLDYSNNILSIRNAYYGVYDKSINNMSTTPATNSMYNTVNSIDPDLNTKMVNAINGAITAIQAIPQPFRNNINTTESRNAQTACATLNDLLTHDLKTFFQNSANTDEVCDPIVANIVDNIIIPTSKDLMDLNNAMMTDITSFRTNPTSAGFAKLADDWIAARQPWESFEAFLFGPVSDDGLDPNMDSWPLDRDNILNILSSQDFKNLEWSGQFIDAEENPDNAQALAIANAQGVRGFHTLEFLIFKNGQARTVNN